MEPQITQPQPRKKHTKLAITLLVTPTLLFILPFLLYIVTQPNTPAFINVLIFLLPVVGFITWLPGFIIGIILLAKKN
jgi:hypothetical protein